jgi:hypothetical protein
VNKRNEFGQKPIQLLSQRPAFMQKCDMQILLLTAAGSKPRPLDVQRTICQSLSVQAFSTMSSEESDTHIIDLVSRLLNLNNDLGVLKRHNGPTSIVLHTKGELQQILISKYLEINKNALNKSNIAGSFPIHLAAQYKTADEMIYLHNIDPRPSLSTNNISQNLLHHVMLDKSSDASEISKKITFALNVSPHFIDQKDFKGRSPLNVAIDHKSYKGIAPLCKVYETIKQDRIVLEDTSSRCVYGHINYDISLWNHVESVKSSS